MDFSGLATETQGQSGATSSPRQATPPPPNKKEKLRTSSYQSLPADTGHFSVVAQ